jgi:hypothetical protein
MPDLDLGTFDGKTIDGVRTKITKAGDSLSKAIVANGENVTHRTGTEVSIVLRGHIGEVAMVPDKDHEDRLVRREEIVTDTITFVDAGLVDDIVEDQKRRNDEHASRTSPAPSAAHRLSTSAACTACSTSPCATGSIASRGCRWGR